MKINSAWAELFYAEERTHRYDEANSDVVLILSMRLIVNQRKWYSRVLIEEYL
jgi:hypothetical protein